ncbi:hypothetical protein [Treponema sp.]|uniref:hypothetical protein n=1 Tax=Treponema sp. TaxID=166 RepID=UPI003F0820C5
MNRNIKKFIFVFALSCTSVFAQEELYKISKVDFISKGKTQENALRKNISDINYKKIFKSKDELEKYLHDIYQNIENTRLIEDIEYSYKISEITEDGISLVEAEYTFDDSHSMIIFPKPSLDTNSGIEVKLKLKDNNFLGLMNALDIDLNLNFGDDDEPDNYSKVTTGFNFSYDYPFDIGITENTWSNSFEFKWTVDESNPEYSYATGITVAVPIGEHKIKFNFTQSIVKDLDYEKYDDDLYFIEDATISVPFSIGYIGNTTEVTYTPSVNFIYNWDKDGISSKNEDLNQTPMIKPGQTVSFDNVNWVGENNFRTGYSFSASQYMGWDIKEDTIDKKIVPSVEANLQLFKSFKYVGFAANINGFAGYNTKFSIGEYLRGAPDKQKFNDYEVDEDNYALKTPAAIVFNFDMPIHIVTVRWLDWSYALFGSYDTKPGFVKAIAFLPHKMFKYLNFEFQLSPFFDVGLIKNRGTGSNLDYKEGIYTGGLEALVYPEKWKSFVVRASLGVDLSKKILDGHMDFDSSWRRGKAWEAYFGLGLQF